MQPTTFFIFIISLSANKTGLNHRFCDFGDWTLGLESLCSVQQRKLVFLSSANPSSPSEFIGIK